MWKKMMVGAVSILALICLVLVVYVTFDWGEPDADDIDLDSGLALIQAGRVKEIVSQADVVVLVLDDNTHQQFAKPTTNDIYVVLLQSGVTEFQLAQITFVEDTMSPGKWFEINRVVPVLAVASVLMAVLWLILLLLTTVHLWGRDLPLSLKMAYFVCVVAIPILGFPVYWINVPSDRGEPLLST